jgi:hypothetical protein
VKIEPEDNSNKRQYVGFEAHTTVVMKVNRPFGGARLATCFTLVYCLAYSSTLNVEATCPLTFNGLHGVKSQKIELFTNSSVSVGIVTSIFTEKKKIHVDYYYYAKSI